MTSDDVTHAQRDGVALVLACLRDDHDGMARLLAACDPEQLIGVAVVCAQFAVTLCRLHRHGASEKHMELALRSLALRLATRPEAPGGSEP